MNKEIVLEIVLAAFASGFLSAILVKLLDILQEWINQKADSLDDNNWYEFVEYGTTNEITVFLQRNGFSRESANYIKDHPEYIFRQDGVLMLRRSLLKCKNNDARTEAELISLNRPKLFEEQEV